MVLASLLVLLQAEAVALLESDDIEVRTRARQELAAMGGKALPALRASGTPEARGVIEAILDAVERAFVERADLLNGCGRRTFLDAAESARRVGELARFLPGCRVRAAHVTCMHRRLCHRGGLFIYGIAEDDAEVFLIRDGGTLGDALLRRLAPVPGLEEDVARTLAGGFASDRLIFDTEGRLVRIERAR
ncbi:MAG TPA: hypothetical protein VF950_16295 [Planctomycetota bacterium]